MAENTAVGSSIEPAIRARDDDNDELTYTLGGSDAAAFTISQRGRLKTEAPLDYETKSSYTVTVTVDDGKGGAASIAVTVNVTRVGNEPPVQQDNSAPVFAEGAATTREVAENTAVGSSIEPAIRATDEDSDELAYTLGGSDAAAFTISQRGRLKTELPLDYETKSSYTVTVTADDGKGGTASITVTVNVTDVENEPPVQRDNSAPVFAEGAAATREVAENTAVGSNIEPAIRARDDDNDELTYTLGGSDAAAFTISQRGRLKTEAPLDYETKSSYTVTVTVDDGKGGTASIAVTVNVTKGGNTRPASVEEPGVSIWTDALAYLPGDDMKLYLHIDPRMREQQEYAVFVYRTELATGERVWLDLSGETASFLPEAIDIYGQAEQALWSRQLEPRDKQLAWEGEVPGAGHWQFVAELRDGSGTYALKRAYATFVVAAGGTAVVASAGEQRQLQADEQWAGNTIHLLRGRVVVPAGVTLQIEAGAHVLAEAGAAIVVDPQGRIVARGRREKPVVMTCASPIGERVPGCWDGLQISGESTGTGESAGPESSGELRYVRVEFAGGRAEGAAGPAVALHRVSGATVLEHVQAHASLARISHQLCSQPRIMVRAPHNRNIG